MNNTEQRRIVLMTGLKTRYSVAGMAQEIDREFEGEYKTIAIPRISPMFVSHFLLILYFYICLHIV